VRGIVLAAGEGRRLRPLTDTVPKTLLAVDGSITILDIALANLAKVGITDVAVVVGYRAEAISSRVEALQRKHGVTLDLIHNDKATVWNNAYSLWLAREVFAQGALLVNGDTVHPASVEQTLLDARGPGVLLALDDRKSLAEEEMKVLLDDDGQLVRIHKQQDPNAVNGEYIGVTLIEPAAAAALAQALQDTFEADTTLYYEDGYQLYAERGGEVRTAPIGEVDWVEVDNHADLARAQEIACLY
jgi:choline kinase